MKHTLTIIAILLTCLGCKQSNTVSKEKKNNKTIIKCTDKGCEGVYIGAEFIEGKDKEHPIDLAHKLSNKICWAVGDKLKEFYKNKKYAKVDFSKIEMSTKGMGTGKVVYKLYIPFVKVVDKCQACTTFEHSGGWNHTPELSKRKSDLNSLLLEGEKFDISDLKTTKEGLQEYWIQLKNKELQGCCVKENQK
jgi:hypothetical protein